MRTHADDADHANINTNTNTNTNTKMNANTNTNRNEIVSGKKESAKGQRGTPRGGGERARYPAGAEERVRKADGPDIGTIRTVEALTWFSVIATLITLAVLLPFFLPFLRQQESTGTAAG